MLFSLVAFGAFAQNRKLDSLYTMLISHPQKDTTRVNLLIHICEFEYQSAQEKNRSHAEEALSISRALEFSKGIGYAQMYLALYYRGRGEYQIAANYGVEVLRIFELADDPKGLGQSYQLLGVIHSENHDFEKAESYFIKAGKIYLDAGLRQDAGDNFNSQGSLYVTFSKYAEALRCYQQTLKLRIALKDKAGEGWSYAHIGRVYMYQENYARSLEYFRRSLPFLETSDTKVNQIRTDTWLGELYIRMRMFGEAEHYLLEAVAIAKTIGNKSILPQTYEKLVLLENARGRYQQALAYFRLKAAYNDSIFTLEKAKEISEIETRYETEKKDKAILLLERDRMIQRLWTNIFIAASLLLAISIVVIYRLQRNREIKNRQILNLKIDFLTSQNADLSQKYKDTLLRGNETTVESFDTRMLNKAIEVIEKNLSDRLFGVEKMAKEMGMSRTNMHRKLKSLTGFPASELIRNIRLRKAAALILNKADSISQISISVGFEDQSYFSKIFKKQFGVPPSEYAESQSK